MSFDRAKTALATLEEKLRRQLGLAGVIGAGFEPALKPVLVTGDLREPGNSFYRGRHFSWGRCESIAAPNQYGTLRFEVDVIVTGWYFQPTVAGVSTVYLTVPNQAGAVVPTQNCGSWTDRRTNVTDLVPLTNGAMGALTGTNFSVTNIIAQINGGASAAIGGPPMYIPAGGAINWNVQAAGFYAMNVWGRIAEQVG